VICSCHDRRWEKARSIAKRGRKKPGFPSENVIALTVSPFEEIVLQAQEIALEAKVEPQDVPPVALAELRAARGLQQVVERADALEEMARASHAPTRESSIACPPA
jgi:hypothetical protein